MSVEIATKVIHVKDGDTYDTIEVLKGSKGDAGIGIVSGGTKGQVLKKKSNDDYDVEWANGIGGISDVRINNTSIVDDYVAVIPVDNSMSSTSENLVKNKVIYEAIKTVADEVDEIENTIGDIESLLSAI